CPWGTACPRPPLAVLLDALGHGDAHGLGLRPWTTIAEEPSALALGTVRVWLPLCLPGSCGGPGPRSRQCCTSAPAARCNPSGHGRPGLPAGTAAVVSVAPCHSPGPFSGLRHQGQGEHRAFRGSP